jgi:hypothetical protein
MSSRRQLVIHVRLSETELERIDAERPQETGRSAWIRGRIAQAEGWPAPAPAGRAPDAPPEVVDALAQLRGAANNWNQLARAANESGELPAAAFQAVGEALREATAGVLQELRAWRGREPWSQGGGGR